MWIHTKLGARKPKPAKGFGMTGLQDVQATIDHYCFYKESRNFFPSIAVIPQLSHTIPQLSQWKKLKNKECAMAKPSAHSCFRIFLIHLQLVFESRELPPT